MHLKSKENVRNSFLVFLYIIITKVCFAMSLIGFKRASPILSESDARLKPIVPSSHARFSAPGAS